MKERSKVSDGLVFVVLWALLFVLGTVVVLRLVDAAAGGYANGPVRVGALVVWAAAWMGATAWLARRFEGAGR